MYKFFTETSYTAETLKKAYHKQAIKLHPDNGGDETLFKAMQAEFEQLFDRYKNIHTTKDGATFTTKKETTETASAFMDAINELIRLHGLQVEICGSWLWVTGDTYAYKERLKELGLTYSKSKKAWYLAGYKSGYSKKGFSLERIRGMYGSTVYSSVSDDREQEAITAGN